MFLKLLVAAALGFACFPGAQAQSGWQVQKSTSPMDDSTTIMFTRRADAAISDPLGTKHKPRFVMSCSRMPGKFGSVRAFLLFDNALFTSVMGTNHVRIRLDDGEVLNEVWSPSTDGSYLFWKPADFVALKQAKTLLLEVKPPLGTAQYMKFTLAGSDKVTDELMEACTMPDAERAAYDADSAAFIRKVWLDELKDTRPGKGYDLAFNFLLAEGLIDAPPASAAPSREPAVPPEQVFEKLSAWMTQSGICVSTYSSSCPTTFAKRVTPSYLARASYVRPSPEPNVQWSARATYLNEPAIHDGSVAAAGE